jgi:hypothetical protein
MPKHGSFPGLAQPPTTKVLLNQLLGTMKPWMLFFSIYTAFLKKNGWKHSVDMEAYEIAK